MTLPANTREFKQFAVTIAFQNDNKNLSEAHVMVDFVTHYAFYAALIALLLMIIALVVKLLWSSDETETTDGSHRPTENTTLLSSKGREFFVTIYGTNDNDDYMESGGNLCSPSSSEDLYDGKICVICYDDQRTCFFIPCGHCVTCHNCAHKIVRKVSKSCPICRGTIYKVKEIAYLVKKM